MTSRLQVDLDKLNHNTFRMRQLAENLGVSLKPHFKTSKSVEVMKLNCDKSQLLTVHACMTAAHFDEYEVVAQGHKKAQREKIR